MQCPTCSGTGISETVIDDQAKMTMRCYTCEGEGEVEDSPPEPTLADVIALIERQAETCERIAKTLGEIHLTVRQMK